MSSLDAHTIRFSSTQLSNNGLYLAAYFAYIIGVVLIAFSLDKFGVMNADLAILTRRANEVFVEKKERKRLLLLSRGGGGREEEEAGGGEGGGVGNCTTPMSPRTHVHHNMFGQKLEHQYESANASLPSEDFWSFLLSGKAYFGITLDKSKSDEAVRCCCCCSCFCCCCSSYGSDFLFYLLNTHTYLSAFACPIGHPYGRQKRQWSYLLQQALAFFLTCLVGSFYFPPYTVQKTKYGTPSVVLTSFEQLTLVNVLLLSPVTLFVSKSIYLLFACPCLRVEVDWSLFRCLKWLFEGFGKYIALSLCFSLSFLCIFLSAFYPTDHFKFLLTYMYQVHAVSLLLEYAYCLAVFAPFYLELLILGKSFFIVGQWQKEKREERAFFFCANTHIKQSVWWGVLEVKRSCWCEGKEQVAVAPAPNFVAAANSDFSLPPTASSPRIAPIERIEQQAAVAPEPFVANNNFFPSPLSSPRIVAPPESALFVIATPNAPSAEVSEGDDGNVEMKSKLVKTQVEEHPR